MMTVMKDSQEGQPECVHPCTKVIVVFWRRHSGYRQLKHSIYLLGGLQGYLAEEPNTAEVFLAKQNSKS